MRYLETCPVCRKLKQLYDNVSSRAGAPILPAICIDCAKDFEVVANALIEAALSFEPVIGCVETAEDIELTEFRSAASTYRKFAEDWKGTLTP